MRADRQALGRQVAAQVPSVGFDQGAAPTGLAVTEVLGEPPDWRGDPPEPPPWAKPDNCRF
jgi:hypothetical protein